MLFKEHISNFSSVIFLLITFLGIRDGEIVVKIYIYTPIFDPPSPGPTPDPAVDPLLDI